MSRKLAIRGWMLVMTVLSSGCASGGTSNPFAAPGANPGEEIRILAQNRSNQDVRVYALSGAKTTNLGVVRARSIESFRMPSPRNNSLRVRLEPLTSMQHTTNSVLVRGGDTLELYIAPDPSNSVLRVR